MLEFPNRAKKLAEDGSSDQNLVSSTSHPAIQANAIAQSPEFYIQTALLWIRCAPDRALSFDSGHPSRQTYFKEQNTNLIARRYTGSDVTEPVAVNDLLPDLGLLELHRDRLQAAADALGWRSLDCFKTSARGLDVMRSSIQTHLDTLDPPPKHVREYRKLRIGIFKSGHMNVDSAIINNVSSQSPTQEPPFQPSSFDEWHIQTTGPPSRVYVDTAPTKPSTCTTHKTSHRPGYDDARSRAKVTHSLPTSEEVLLYNQYGEVMETSVCTIYLRRNDGWITPAAICGGNLGVTRRLALESGLCTQGVVEVKDLGDGEEVWLSNAVRGFFRGTIVRLSRQVSNNAGIDAVDWAASPNRKAHTNR